MEHPDELIARASNAGKRSLPGIQIRRATERDVGAVLGLFDSAIAWFVRIGNTAQWGTQPASDQQKWIARAAVWCASPDTWVAELPGVGVCGAIVLGEAMEYVPPAVVPELYVRVLIGSRDPRAAGVGRELLAFAEVRAQSEGVSQLRVDCYAGASGDLVRYYERCGYVRADTFSVAQPSGPWPGQVLTRTLR
ncbi:GNAT family N-acetyltransferase [Leucobacter sp. 7(1)]|uniref:GNAT family N-acetyltransferase n=1 Tax=Leucobacter sp. 7(1) TaxID=1255613 RepID=UPI001C3E7061|nr:GNAT family N-acetyltransferase [Leucobacter sp. 7(1)]